MATTRAKIASRQPLGAPPASLRLVLRGREMGGDVHRLSDCGLSRESVVFVVRGVGAAADAARAGGGGAGGGGAGAWECMLCSLENPGARSRCSICGYAKPTGGEFVVYIAFADTWNAVCRARPRPRAPPPPPPPAPPPPPGVGSARPRPPPPPPRRHCHHQSCGLMHHRWGALGC